MGTRIVNTPKGPVSFPDTMTDDQISGVLSREFPQPQTQPASMGQQVAASPVGRLSRSLVVDPVLSGLSMLDRGGEKVMSGFGAFPNPLSATHKFFADQIDALRQKADSGYDAANAAVSHTPGYSPARTKANAIATANPTGFKEAMLAPIAAPIAGAAAYTAQGLHNLISPNAHNIPASDAMNAAMDSTDASQAQYGAEHPIANTAASLASGLLLGPEGAMKPRPTMATGGISHIPASPAALDYVTHLATKAGVTPDILAQRGADTFGKPITGAEVIGPSATTHLGALARQAGDTGASVAGTFGTRAAERYARQQGDFAAATGVDPVAASGDINAIVENGQKAAQPLYDKAYSRGIVRTKTFDALMQAPSMKQAMGYATNIFGDQYAADRAAGKLGSATPEDWQKFVASVGGKTAFPTEYLDYVKRGLDSYLESFRNPTTGVMNLRDPAVRAAQNVRSQFVSEARKMNPDYGRALDHAGDYLSAKTAFDWAGKSLFDPKVSEGVFSGRMDTLSPAEQAAAKGGVANKIFDMTQNNRLTPAMLRTARIKAKLAAMFGKDGAENFIKRAEVENQMRVGEARIPADQNSVTAGVKAAIDEQGQFGGTNQHVANAIGDLVDARGNPIHAMMAGAARHGQAALDAWRTRGMPVEIRNEAGRLLQLSPQELADEIRAYAKANGIKTLQRQPLPLNQAIPQGIGGLLVNTGQQQ